MDTAKARPGSGHPGPALIEAAISLLQSRGPDAVQARTVAAAIGMSTMAVYTHFGGMPELLQAVIAEGFARFTAHVEATPETDDPMADFFAKGIAYRQWALQNPQLYRLMFGLSGAATLGLGRDLTRARTISALPEGQAAFGVMTHSLKRVRDSGRIDPVDVVAAAGQFLAATHGFVLLEIAGYLGTDGDGLPLILAPLGLSIMVGLGATREDALQAGIAALAVHGIA